MEIIGYLLVKIEHTKIKKKLNIIDEEISRLCILKKMIKLKKQDYLYLSKFRKEYLALQKKFKNLICSWKLSLNKDRHGQKDRQDNNYL